MAAWMTTRHPGARDRPKPGAVSNRGESMQEASPCQTDGIALRAEITRRILTVLRPHRIVLFGSRARGEARTDSDWDILVIADSDQPRYRRSRPLYGALSSLRVPCDVLVYTPREVEEWKQVNSAFITTALGEGTVLYEDGD